MTATWPQTGTPGSGEDARLTHVQSTPASVWWITHELLKFPAVTVVDEDGNEVDADVSFPTLAEVVVRFSGEMTGRVFLN